MTQARYSSAFAGNNVATRRRLQRLLTFSWLALVTLVALEVTVGIWGYSERQIYDPIYTSY